MNLKGYIFSRPFFGERVPQNVQNIVLRDYCKKNNYQFNLSATEFAMPKSSFILSEILLELQKYDGLVFYSMFQVPEKKDSRIKFYNKIVTLKKSVHFVLENLICKDKNDFYNLEKIFQIKQQVFQSDQNKKKGGEGDY